jgi:serine/threonine-protein kinase
MSPGLSLAHYRITSKLGEGGMGEVWRATDTKLDREVAIKILPDAVAQDAERLARFEREAKVLASLNHPNIAAIYGVEERALVMELVEGPTLADRIAHGAILLDEALPIAKQIAEALEYAHEKGIIHRDLKPANIKITPEVRVKVLDFGLAKAMASESVAGDSTSASTLTMRATQLGVIIGTAAYMSPEQAKGKPVDRRADIWAFGVVLAEMLSGRQMYTGETLSETLAAVIMKDPEIPKSVPGHVQALLRRCLDKDPQQRLQAIGEARIAIDRAEADMEPAAAPPVPRRSWLPWIIAIAVAIAGAAGWWRAMHPNERHTQRISADLGPDAVAGSRITVAISPDGTRIVFPVRSQGSHQLATRLMNQSQAIVLAGTEDARDPFFKPDGQWIAFFAGGKLKKTSVQGGAAMTLCDSGSGDRGGWWGEDGNIIATLDAQHLFRVPEAGGTSQMLRLKSATNERTAYRWPQILPGGEILLATAGTIGSFENADIVVISLKTGDVKTIARGGYFGRYLPSGHLIYIHQGTLFAMPFDPQRLETRGTPVPIQQEIAGNTTNGGGQIDFSRTGTLVYLSGKSTAEVRTIAWLDAAGKKVPLITPQGAVLSPRLSPDGTRLAFALNSDISIYDPQRGGTTRITFDGAGNSYIVWAPDGKHIVYAQSAGGIWWSRADGSAQPVRILESSSWSAPYSFSPNGRLLAFSMVGADASLDIWVLPLDTADPDHPKAGKPELFAHTPQRDGDPAFSPDGRWIAYYSSESGPGHVYVRPYPANPSGGKWQISTEPGMFPIWSRNGKELFYESSDGRIFVVDYTAKGETFSAKKPRQWSDATIQLTGIFPNLDLAPDGKRFVVFPTSDVSGSGKTNVHVTFLFDFFDELRRTVK